jgi:ABC-2 type transport system permease protein
MRKMSLVMHHELINTFTRPSYLLFAFGIPILAVLILGGVKLIQGRSTTNSETSLNAPSEYQLEIEGFVDHSGLIQTISEDLQSYLLPFETEIQAQLALESGEISAYYVIPVDYMVQGEVYYVYPDDKPYLSDGQQWVIKWILNLNLLDGDLALADLIWNPIWHLDTQTLTPEFEGAAISGEDCSRPGIACESNELIRMMPSMMVLIFFFAFMSSSSMLFNSIGTEKENRTIELLMLSINPRQLLAGKTLALGIAGMTQTVIWLVAIYISFNLGGSTLSLPEGFRFPVEIVAWSLVFFIGGFSLYASLMAGAGALVPKMKEAGIANFIALFPLFFGYVFGIMAPLAEATGSTLLLFLSIFPLTSPVVMIMRLTDGFVPLWQMLLSVGLLFVTAYGAFQMVAAMFHAQNLLSGQPFSVKRYLLALAGRT